MREYLAHLLSEEDKRQLKLPASEPLSIADAQGRRKILTDILSPSFADGVVKHLENQWQNQ